MLTLIGRKLLTLVPVLIAVSLLTYLLLNLLPGDPALLVLGPQAVSPESIAAVRNAMRDRVQTSLNLAYGSAMASIGLTIPTIAVAMIWLAGPLELGLEPTQMVLLAITVVVTAFTVVQGRAHALQGMVHLVLLSAFLFLSVQP